MAKGSRRATETVTLWSYKHRAFEEGYTAKILAEEFALPFLITPTFDSRKEVEKALDRVPYQSFVPVKVKVTFTVERA